MKRLALLLLFLAAPACADILPARPVRPVRPPQAAPAAPKPTGCAAPTGPEAALVLGILLSILVLGKPRLRRA
jgi:hypothetical protein